MEVFKSKQGLILGASGSAIALAGLIYLVKTWNRNDTHEYPPPSVPRNSWLFGTTDLVKALVENRFVYYLFDQHKALGKVFRVSVFGKEQYIIADADEIHRILNNGSEFYRDGELQQSFKSISESALFLLPTGEQGGQWQRHRKLLSYGFSQTHLNHGFEQALGSAKEISQYWLSLNGEPFNLLDSMRCLALDVIGHVLFSQHMGAINALKESTESTEYHLLKPLAPIVSRRSIFPSWLWVLLGVAPFQVKNLINPIRNLALDILKEKEKKGMVVKADKDMDILDRLLTKGSNGEDKFTPDEIADEVIGFYLAGQGTTSAALTFAILCLIQNPEVKHKLVVELERELKETSPTVQNLPKLQYLDAFIKEVLRLYPIATTVERRNANEAVIGGYTISKNSHLLLNIYCMQRGSWTWGDDSEEFRPERFIDSAYLKHGWQPFGGGPNVCIGMRMALLEIKAALATILTKVDFELVPGQNLIPESALSLQFERGLYIKVKPRA